MSTHNRRPMSASIRRMTRPGTIWYHPSGQRCTWRELKTAFASVGGLTVARAILLGWSTDPRNGSAATANPVNVVLDAMANRKATARFTTPHGDAKFPG